MKKISIGDFEVGGGAPLVLIAGPCVIEDEEKTMEIARDLKGMTGKLGIPLIFKASYDKAIRIYKKLIDMNPKKAAGYASAAYVYGLKGDPDRQIEYYLKSLKWDSEDDEVYVNLGAAYEKRGLFQEALKAYTNAYELNPDSATAARKIPQMKIRILQQKQ